MFCTNKTHFVCHADAKEASEACTQKSPQKGAPFSDVRIRLGKRNNTHHTFEYTTKKFKYNHLMLHLLFHALIIFNIQRLL